MENKIGKTIDLDLVGVNGNAFSIIGAFTCQAKREHWTQDEISLVLDEAQNGDYHHLLATMMTYCEPKEDEEDVG